jgi:autotransporter-associated beta strand protein
MTLSGAVGGTGGMVKTGTGILILSASNNYSGTTDIQGGKFYLGTAGRLGSGAVTIASGANLDFGTGSGQTNIVANIISGDGTADFHDAFGIDRRLRVVGAGQQADESHEVRHGHETVPGRILAQPLGRHSAMALLETHRTHPRRISVEFFLHRLGQLPRARQFADAEREVTLELTLAWPARRQRATGSPEARPHRSALSAEVTARR